MRYLIGIDAGNTSSKVVLFDELGEIISSSSTSSMRFERRADKLEEFDLSVLWNLISDCIKRVIDNSGVDSKDIKGIGVTSFGNGLVFLGKDGEIIAPGVFSNDYRANNIIDLYDKEGSLDKINNIVKGDLFAGEPGPLLRWYKEYDIPTYEKIESILMFKDYIMYKLTGEFATDLNCFGGSFMVDLETGEYSKELMQLYGIEDLWHALPKLAKKPTDIIGYITPKASVETGLNEGTPVVAGMMDILSCLVGSGGTDDDVYTLIAGSWCINETHSDRIIEGASSNMPYINEGEYLNCSYTGSSGSNYEWFNKILGDRAKNIASDQGRSHYKVLDEMIEKINPAKAKVFYSPFIAQPSIHQNAKANFINIGLNTTYEELVYSLAEGTGFIHKQHVDFLREANLPLKEIRLTGGTSKSKTWNKLFANILQAPIVGVDCEETGALGAAIVAGIGSGVYKDYSDAKNKAVKLLDPIYPDEKKKKLYERRFKEWQAINKAMEAYWDVRGKF